MGRYLAYATSTLFLVGFGFAMWWGYQAIHPDFAIIGWIEFTSIAIATPIFIGLKLWAMYKNDTLMLGQKKAPAKRIAQPRNRG